MRKIAIVGFKGGIGKTTICVNLGAGLALRGHKVLLIDTDTQANLALSLGVKEYQNSLADVLNRQIKAKDCIINARKNLDLLPGSLSLFKAQQRMVLEMAREEIFDELLVDVNNYQYQIFDCAPSLSLLTVNAMYYVDEVFIPVSMEMLAVAGARQFMTYLRQISRMLGRSATIQLIVPSFYDPRRKVSKIVLDTLIKDFGKRVTHPIWVDTKLSEAPGEGKTIFEYAPRSRGASDYAKLTELVAAMPPLKGNSHKS
ncbi:MAG: ParA family protein [Anaerolineae bacterium]